MNQEKKLRCHFRDYITTLQVTVNFPRRENNRCFQKYIFANTLTHGCIHTAHTESIAVSVFYYQFFFLPSKLWKKLTKFLTEHLKMKGVLNLCKWFENKVKQKQWQNQNRATNLRELIKYLVG